MPPALTLDVRDRLAQEPWAHARRGVLTIPSEAQHVAGLPAGRVAAPTFEQLHESRQVVTRGCADQQVYMRPEEAERHDCHVLLDRDPPKEFVEERSRGNVDHRPSRQS